MERSFTKVSKNLARYRFENHFVESLNGGMLKRCWW